LLIERENEAGELTLVFDLYVFLFLGEPDQPYELAFVNVTHETITFSWNPGFNGGLPQKFQVRYKQKKKPGFTYIDITPEDTKVTTFFTIKGSYQSPCI